MWGNGSATLNFQYQLQMLHSKLYTGYKIVIENYLSLINEFKYDFCNSKSTTMTYGSPNYKANYSQITKLKSELIDPHKILATVKLQIGETVFQISGIFYKI